MAGPVARDRRRKRPSSVERTASIGRTPSSLAETTPFVRREAVPEQIGEPFGPYLVYEQLGEGGMAYVHRAELVGEGGLRKPVALKRLLTASAEDPKLVEAFVHEAQLAAKLRHPNIAQAYDLGRIDNTYYIAMELVPGPTLAQVMQQAANGGGAVPLPIALEILIQLCDALDHAHELRDDAGRPLDLVHRDVSPMNVIISRSGCVKLIDFGIAKVRSARRVTETGMIKGKHAYIAPEYTYGQLDRRADLFGLGVVAHELLTGRRLFVGETDIETIRNIRELNVAPPSRYSVDISPQLDEIVLKALERDPDQRWQTAGAMRTALTDERHRLGVVVTGRQIRDWAEWAFQQTPRRPSSVDRMLAHFEASRLSVSIEIECPPLSRAERLSHEALAPTEPMEASSIVTALADTLVASAALATIPPDDEVSSSVVTAIPQNDVSSSIVTALAEGAVIVPNQDEIVTALAPRIEAAEVAPRSRAPSPQAYSPRVQAAVVAASRRAKSPIDAVPARLAASAESARLVAVPHAAIAQPAVVAQRAKSAVVAQPVVHGHPAARRNAVVARPSTHPAAIAHKRVRRAPPWRAPTRWIRPPRQRSLAPLVLLALIGFAAWLVYAGWIDVDRWREIIATYLA